MLLHLRSIMFWIALLLILSLLTFLGFFGLFRNFVWQHVCNVSREGLRVGIIIDIHLFLLIFFKLLFKLVKLIKKVASLWNSKFYRVSHPHLFFFGARGLVLRKSIRAPSRHSPRIGSTATECTFLAVFVIVKWASIIFSIEKLERCSFFAVFIWFIILWLCCVIVFTSVSVRSIFYGRNLSARRTTGTF